MQLKSFLPLLTAIAISFGLHAQDKIYKRSGDIIEAKVLTVGARTITYTRFDNPTGPEYTIMKVEVDKIKYQNGSEDSFGDERPRPPRMHPHKTENEEPGGTKVKYGSNLLAIAPIEFTENGLGFSLGYDRVLDKGGIVIFSVPVVATFNLNNSTYYNNTTGTYTNGKADAMYYLMPGVKLFPTGCYGKVRYSVGPSVVMGTGQRSSAVYDINGNTTYISQTHTLLGILVNNALNINPTPHLYMGLELGLGFTYLDRVGGLNQDTQGLVQGNFKVGYRF